MPVSDSKYSNPDSLRLLYIAPRALSNALDLDDKTSANDNAIPVGIITGQNHSPGVIPYNRFGCPMVGQFILLKKGNRIYLEKVENIKTSDFIYNPITGTKHKIRHTGRFKKIECVKITTFDGAEKICSLSAPILQSFSDKVGLAVSEIIERGGESGAVSCIKFAARETEIQTIHAVGKHDIIFIELIDGHIFWTGTDNKLVAEHNKPLPVDSDDIPDQV